MKTRFISLLSTSFIIAGASAQVAPVIGWQRSFGGSAADFGGRMCVTSEGRYLLVGGTLSTDGDVTDLSGVIDGWVLHVNTDGELMWEQTLGGTDLEEGGNIHTTSDNGSIAAFATYSNDGDVTDNHGGNDIWAVRLNHSGELMWQHALGGSGSDWCGPIEQTTDGGFILVGSTMSADGDVSNPLGDADIWVVRLDSAGNIQWQRTLGGSGSDGGARIRATTDGGYVVLGNTTSNDGDVSGNHGSHDGWVAKLNSSGGVDWQRALGGTDFDFLYDVRQTADGGYILVGDAYSFDGDVTGNHGFGDIWVVKLDLSGGLDWQRCLGGSDPEVADFIAPGPDGGYLVAGGTLSSDGDVTSNYGDWDAWVLSLDQAGAIVWQRTMGGSGYDMAYSIYPTNDDGYIVSAQNTGQDGDIIGNHGEEDIWLVKLVPGNVDVSGTPSPSLFTASPNPCQDLLRIKLDIDVKDASATFLDATGREVLRVGLSGLETTLPVAQLGPGAYSLIVHSGQAHYQRTLIIE